MLPISNYRVFAFALVWATVSHAAVSIESSVDAARISRVESTPSADIVLIDAGHEAGLRQGMVCVATRDGARLGELLLVDMRNSASSALILDLESGATLRSGDQVAVKTVSSTK
jgi:cell shape-determining protein MreC